MYVSREGCEYGAPVIDCKNPYGNSDVEDNIYEILCKKESPINCDEQYLSEDLQYDARVHKEMETALQTFFCAQAFREGTYRKVDKFNLISWQFVN